MTDKIYSIVLGYTDSRREANGLTNELCILLGVSKWQSVNDKPDRSHIDKRTQFILKGYFQIDSLKGEEYHIVSRLVDYLEEADEVYFDQPANYVITEWKHIN